MFYLEVRKCIVINNNKGLGTRFHAAQSVTHSWKMQQIAISNNKSQLIEYAKKLNPRYLFDNKLWFQISDNETGKSEEYSF